MDLEKNTNNADKPMENWTRVIIETDEKNPKTIAVVVNDDYEVADGFRVRLKPSTCLGISICPTCDWIAINYSKGV